MLKKLIHRTICLPDIHVPNHDERAISAVLQFIKYYKPNRLIQLGDFCDWDSVTDYAPKKESDITNIERELSAAHDMLDRIEAAVPKGCELFMVGGNHEARYERFKTNHSHKAEIRRLKVFSSWEEEYALPKRGWDSVDYGHWYIFGKIVYFHGKWLGGTSAKRHLEYFKRNVIYGHTHQRLIATTTDRDGLPMEAESIGTLSRFNLSYLDLPSHDWVHGFCYIDTLPNGRFSKHFVHVLDGKFIEHGKEF